MDTAGQYIDTEQYTIGHHDEKRVAGMDMDQDMRGQNDNQIQQDVDTARQDNEDVSELYIWGSKQFKFY